MTFFIKNDIIYDLNVWGGIFLKKILLALLFILVFISGYSAGDSSLIEYKNVEFNVNSYETELSTNEEVIPLYTNIKYNLNKDSRINPYLLADLGFSYVDGMEENSQVTDITQNPYGSLGVGMELGEALSMEAAYTTYRVGYEDEDNPTTEDRMMLRLNYRY